MQVSHSTNSMNSAGIPASSSNAERWLFRAGKDTGSNHEQTSDHVPEIPYGDSLRVLAARLAQPVATRQRGQTAKPGSCVSLTMISTGQQPLRVAAHH